MNREVDATSEERFEVLLAEYAGALDSGRPRPVDESKGDGADPDLVLRLNRAQGCLRLIDRVRRTRPDSLKAPKDHVGDHSHDAVRMQDIPKHIG
jgi:hypothetical protein